MHHHERQVRGPVGWREHGSKAALLYESSSSTEGVEVGTALTLTEPRPFSRRIPLQDMRAKPRGFRPPRSFAYVDTNLATDSYEWPRSQSAFDVGTVAQPSALFHRQIF